jgi:hypothetical protein
VVAFGVAEFGVFSQVFMVDFGIFWALLRSRFLGRVFAFIELLGSIEQKKRFWSVLLRAGCF